MGAAVARGNEGDHVGAQFGIVGRTTYAVGDKVMQVENDYDKEVYNGDVGFVEAINLETGEIVIDFDGRSVSFLFGELDQVVLAYATTIHKSQGSEYPVVVIPVLTQHYAMLQRNLLYTGVTRGQAARHHSWSEKSCRHGCEKHVRPPEVVQAPGLVGHRLIFTMYIRGVDPRRGRLALQWKGRLTRASLRPCPARKPRGGRAARARGTRGSLATTLRRGRR